MTVYTNENAAQRGNVLVVVLVVLLVGALGALAYTSGKIGNKTKSEEAETANAEQEAPANPVLVKLDGEEITQQDVVAFIGDMPAQMQQIPQQQLLPLALQQLIQNKIVDKKAAGANLENDEDVLKQVALAKKQIIRTKFIEDVVDEKLTEDRLKKEYDEYLKKFPEIEEARASHILVDDEAKAKDLIKQLNKGAEFAELAAENSKDGSAQNGGDIGYFVESEVVPEFADAAFKLKPGEYTKAPVKSQFGYHIIKLAEVRKRPPAEYAQIKPYMEQELRRMILDETLTEWQDDVEIVRYDAQGNPIAEAGVAEEPAAEAEGEAVEAEEAETEAQPEEGAAAEEEAKEE